MNSLNEREGVESEISLTFYRKKNANYSSFVLLNNVISCIDLTY